MELPPGSGPRHFTFHPNGELLYVLNELLATIQPYRYDAAAGTFTPLTLLPTLPDDFTDPNTAADIHITPDGQYLYSTNRGHNSIAMCRIEANGELTLIGRESTRGDHPRFFNLGPTGKFLIVSNQFSSNVLSYHIDYATGKLEYTGHELAIPAPSCIYSYTLQD
jgi:6-phosphogluconolactonase